MHDNRLTLRRRSLNPKPNPQILNPKPQTPNPKPQTPTPKQGGDTAKSVSLNPKPKT